MECRGKVEFLRNETEAREIPVMSSSELARIAQAVLDARRRNQAGYEQMWRMAYVRGPEGIIVALAQRIG